MDETEVKQKPTNKHKKRKKPAAKSNKLEEPAAAAAVATVSRISVSDGIVEVQQNNSENALKRIIIKRKRNKKKVPTSDPAHLQPIVPVATQIPTNPIIEKVEKLSETIIEPILPKMNETAGSNKSKEQVLAEREAKRLAKQIAKQKLQDKNRNLTDSPSPPAVKTELAEEISTVPPVKEETDTGTKSREQVLAEREQKKLAKLAAKNKSDSQKAEINPENLAEKVQNLTIAKEPLSQPVKVEAKTVPSKAERRAKQEAQRAAKAALATPKSAPKSITAVSKKDTVAVETNDKVKPVPIKKSPVSGGHSTLHRVKLFNHLYEDKQSPENLINSTVIHPAIVKLGIKYSNGNVVGSNARCIAFMNTMKIVIEDYKTPSQKEFSRGLEEIIQPCINYLHQCRPLSVSITNALKFIKWQISQLPTDVSDDNKLKDRLIDSIETYIRDQIEKAAQAISISVQEKISNGDVILTFGCSSLINHILDEAQKRNVDFRVVVVDARPDHEGLEMLRRLVAQGIRCTCVLINAVGFIMPEVTKVLLGAHALMANGYVMSRAGTAQVAMVAKNHNVPVLVCCETHKFSERVQTDAFVYNEIGNPQDLVLGTKSKHLNSALSNWESSIHLTPLHLRYDITPPELVTAVITELAILPCTSVPVILRIKPSEIGY